MRNLSKWMLGVTALAYCVGVGTLPGQVPHGMDNAVPGRQPLLHFSKLFAPADSIVPQDVARFAVGRRGDTVYAYSEFGLAYVGTMRNADHRDLHTKTDWTVMCAKDAITDAKMCAITHRTLFVVLGEPPGIAVRGEGTDGTRIAIRVDGGRAFTAPQMFVDSLAIRTILAALSRGTEVVTRHYEWPSETPTDDRYPLFGFKVALELARWLLANLR